MIIDIACIRNKGDDMVNNFIFNYRMKQKKAHVKAGLKLLNAGSVLIIPKTPLGGIYSYEMMNHAMTTGDFINALTFGLLPVLQGLDVNNIKMTNTYIKDKIGVHRKAQ